MAMKNHSNDAFLLASSINYIVYAYYGGNWVAKVAIPLIAACSHSAYDKRYQGSCVDHARVG